MGASMTYRRFTFRMDKAIQASGLFLSLAGGSMNYMKMLKLLYIAEREALATECDIITGDRVCSMPHGPVLSTILNLIKRKDSQSPLWHKFFKTERNYQLSLKKDPGIGELYKYEIDIIEKVYKEYGEKGEWQLRDFTHSFHEWKKHKDGLDSPEDKNSFTISWEDILEGLGKSEMLPRVERNVAEQNYYRKLGRSHECTKCFSFEKF